MSQVAPTSYSELAEALNQVEQCRIIGTGTGQEWLPASESPLLSTKHLNKILDFRPDDLVVTVQSGLRTADLQSEISKAGLCLPFAPSFTDWLSPAQGTVGGLLALGLPHANEAKFGQVRDWVTGMKLMLADGRIVSVGAQVVKSVAGYDLHRTMVGSRGGLAVILEATLRLRSIASLTEPDLFLSGEPVRNCWVHRFPRSKFEELANQVPQPLAGDCESGLLWSALPASNLGDGWAIGPSGQRRPGPTGIPATWERNLRNMMDPTGKFDAGWI
ncbi:FAD-binding oxidoreductase [Kamptonema cortianum]|nr:FAD-binding oxidoreductase [Geitlerinema splendidum]MDK3156954.1 FAD-binding oxidoreductase [Kamptonema cortianum]